MTAEGPLGEVGPASFYKVVTKPGEAASTLSQVFLGVRIACAECHHHPFDRWSQADYYGDARRSSPRSRFAAGAARRGAVGERRRRGENPRTGDRPRARAGRGGAEGGAAGRPRGRRWPTG